MSALPQSALDQLFLTARTCNEWSDLPVDEHTVRNLYDLFKWGPTSGNSCPARFVWVRSAGAKSQLASLASDMNRAKIVAAPLSVIVGHDLALLVGKNFLLVGNCPLLRLGETCGLC